MADNSFRIGFSTTNKWTSRFIRWVTRSKVSHVYVSLPMFGDRLVFQSDSHGVAMEWWSRFEAHNKIVAEFELQDTPGGWKGWRGALATKALFPLLHAPYDFKAVWGFAWVLLGRVFGRRWKNPFAQRSAYVCSEFGLLWLQAGGVDKFEGLDSERLVPEDVLELCYDNKDLALRDKEVA